MPTFLPFLIFSFICVFIVGLLLILFKIGAYFGRSDVDEFRAVRCPQCQTRRKPEKTGEVRNLVEHEMRCPRCVISWDIHQKQTYPHVPPIAIISKSVDSICGLLLQQFSLVQRAELWQNV